MQSTLADGLYREQGIDFGAGDCSLAEMVDRVAALPLLAQPGAEWNYSVATDVLGQVVAAASGEDFAEFLQDRIITPLGMGDTWFQLPEADRPRFAANYARGADGKLTVIDDPETSPYLKPKKLASGGGGLVSTAPDYMRFCHFMLNKGELDGERLVGRKTIELMTTNHLGRRHGRHGHAPFQRSVLRGHRVRPGLLRHAGPRPRADPGHAGRIRLGRCRLHRLLVRPGGGTGRGDADAADAVPPPIRSGASCGC